MDQITIFIDETIRFNKLYSKFDGIPKNVKMYSFIAFEGDVTDETWTIEKKILLKGVGEAMDDSIQTTWHVTNYGIGAVLYRIAMETDFRGKVKIYTDNLNSYKTWQSCNILEHIVNYYTEVEVFYIPRERNTQADAVGRELTLLTLHAGMENQLLSVASNKSVHKYENQIQMLEEALDREKSKDMVKNELRNQISLLQKELQNMKSKYHWTNQLLEEKDKQIEDLDSQIFQMDLNQLEMERKITNYEERIRKLKKSNSYAVIDKYSKENGSDIQVNESDGWHITLNMN